MKSFLRITNQLELRITNARGCIRNSLKFVIRRRGFTQHHFGAEKSGAGFTLLEMVVSLGIFSVVMIVAAGTVISIEGAQKKAQSLQNVQDNLRYTLESMTKEIRNGSGFVGGMSDGVAPQSLTFQVANRASSNSYTYCLIGTSISRFTSPGGATSCDVNNPAAVTDASITVKHLYFYLIGTGANDGQPRITVIMKAQSGIGRNQTTYQLQTTVTARKRDAS